MKAGRAVSVIGGFLVFAGLILNLPTALLLIDPNLRLYPLPALIAIGGIALIAFLRLSNVPRRKRFHRACDRNNRGDFLISFCKWDNWRDRRNTWFSWRRHTSVHKIGCNSNRRTSFHDTISACARATWRTLRISLARIEESAQVKNACCVVFGIGTSCFLFTMLAWPWILILFLKDS